MSIPQPAFTVNFETGESNTPGGFQLMNGAAVKDGAPGAVSKALRIDSDGPYVLFPNLDISPSKYPELSMIIEFYLESIPEGSKGWLLNHDNGGYDRALVLHDERFGGISHGVGYPAGPVYDTYTVPEVGKWVQMVVTYRQGGECAVFVSNEKAPITHDGRNNDGKSTLTLGRVVPYKNHWCDCWIKGVSVYDKGLSDEEVDSIFGKFKEEVIVPSGEASDEESVDEVEEVDESVDEGEEVDGGQDGIQNVALGKHAAQSSTFPNYGGVASNAVNGITTGKRKNANSTVTCTADDDHSPWWQVYLCGVYDICKINIFNRDSLQWRNKLKDFTVEVISKGKVVWSSGIITEFPNPEAMISIPGGITGDMVKISKNTKHLIMAEVQVWGTPSSQTVPVPVPVPEPKPVININNGDLFNYGPWGGNCQAFYVAGVLWMNRIGSSVQGTKTWKCKNVADTKKLLNGQTVSIEWDNSGKYLSMTATDNDTLKVMHGTTAYYFKREPEEPVISIKEGDEFFYEPWGGRCIASYVNGSLLMNRAGSSSAGIKTWSCKSADETMKLLSGSTVGIEWDNSGKYLDMTVTDTNTLKVMHGTTAYFFKRMMPLPAGSAFNYAPWGGKCVVSYGPTGKMYLGRTHVARTAKAYCMSMRNVYETSRLRAGFPVKVNWDNRNLYDVEMTMTDPNTLSVLHSNNQTYKFTKM